MSNIAKKIIIPDQPGIFRTIFLYVGQGEATLMVIPDGSNYKYLLIDCNIDKRTGEIDLVKLFNDLMDDKIDIFANTHPHKDHLEGIKEVYDSVSFKEIWHSGHEPKGKHKDFFTEFKNIMDEFDENDVHRLLASNESDKLDGNVYNLGDITFQVLSPAEYVCDDIEGEDADTHYRRIHEQCAVIKFTYGKEPKSILVTGDSDLCAWKNHITDYHNYNLEAIVLSASHHGSRTFFKNNEDDNEEYTKHIELIKPQYIIVSAPIQEESEHGHPHDDAMDIYEKFVEKHNLLHLGKNKECVIVDIHSDGNIELRTDKDLVEEYGFKDENGNGDKSHVKKSIIGVQTTKLDDKPMGKKKCGGLRNIQKF